MTMSSAKETRNELDMAAVIGRKKKKKKEKKLRFLDMNIDKSPLDAACTLHNNPRIRELMLSVDFSVFSEKKTIHASIYLVLRVKPVRMKLFDSLQC